MARVVAAWGGDDGAADDTTEEEAPVTTTTAAPADGGETTTTAESPEPSDDPGEPLVFDPDLVADIRTVWPRVGYREREDGRRYLCWDAAAVRGVEMGAG